MHLESISNGLGAPSLLLVIMAIRREIPATVAITADTGWENDRLWNTGRRSSNEQYFNEIIVPLCQGSHVTPYFVRGVNKHGIARPTLKDALIEGAKRKLPAGVPMFGSRGGRFVQSCTDKMKIQACRQQARRLGAATNCNAQGIHSMEADRRIKGRFLRMQGGWGIYQTGYNTKGGWKDVKWQTHYYPFVDIGMDREAIYKAVEREGVPYLISSECDLCPHKDLARWERTSPEVIEEGAQIEAMFGGEYFFTDQRVPLKEAIANMQRKRAENPELFNREADFGCGNAICGV